MNMLPYPLNLACLLCCSSHGPGRDLNARKKAVQSAIVNYGVLCSSPHPLLQAVDRLQYYRKGPLALDALREDIGKNR